MKVSLQPCPPFLEASTLLIFAILSPTYLTPVAVLFLSGEGSRWRGLCIGGKYREGGRESVMACLVVTASCHLGSTELGEQVVIVVDIGPPPRTGLGDHWLFPPGRTGGICPTDAHPHPDPRVGSQPAHGLQSTLQSEPKTVSTCSCGGLGRWGLCGVSVTIRGLPSHPAGS